MTMKCPKCGYENKEGAERCDLCKEIFVKTPIIIKVPNVTDKFPYNLSKYKELFRAMDYKHILNARIILMLFSLISMYLLFVVLPQRGSNRSTDRIIQQLSSNNWKMRAASVQVLGQMKSPRSIEPLIAALRDEDERVRYHVPTALKRLTGEDFGDNYDKWRIWWEKNKEIFDKQR